MTLKPLPIRVLLRDMAKQDLSWCLRKLPRHVFNLLQSNPNKLAVAGGFIRSCVTGEKINDVDLFLLHAGDTQEAVHAEAMRIAIAVNDSQETWQPQYRVRETKNAVTLLSKPYPVQIITRWVFQEPADVLLSFDFTISQALIYWNGSQWIGQTTNEFYEDIAARRLVYTSPARNEDAGGSMLRVLKFYQRGYRIPLDSLGAVLARLQTGVKQELIGSYPETEREAQMAKVLTGLLREVDPNVDPTHAAHLPSVEAEDLEPVADTEGDAEGTE